MGKEKLASGYIKPHQRRTLTHFEVISGFNGDDFMMNRKSVRILFKLDRQKQMRGWIIQFHLPLFDDMPVLRRHVWNIFKRTFNIYR